ncbi:MAG: sigma-54 dependent transcriptional regulator [Bacteroidia bacterium]|nr:sigma-54 dependent transcriptional regulator [Bacteroidia bacterium]
MKLEQVKQRFSIIGENDRLLAAIEMAMQVAPTEVAVLVVGENGTGKDVFSKIIHQLGKRRLKPFIAINCGAIPEGTIDSELFGHEKGSFTSAYESRKGYFEEANGGVIFLDEIAEMPMATQSRLLRLLENGEFLRVGSSKVQKTDVRVVAATNKNLVEAIRLGKFREDLYFRLNAVTIQVPSLRERGKDIELLFRYFAHEFSSKYGREPVHLTPESIPSLLQYRWPGNIRELRNFVEKLTVILPNPEVDTFTLKQHLPSSNVFLPVSLSTPPAQDQFTHFADSNAILIRMLFEIKQEISELRKMISSQIRSNQNYEDDYPVSTIHSDPYLFNAESLGSTQPIPESRQLDESLSIEKKEKDLIVRALSKFKNNRKRAAAELGISERTLYRKLKSYGLED